MACARRAGGEFVEAGRDGAELLEPVEAALDDVEGPAEVAVEGWAIADHHAHQSRHRWPWPGQPGGRARAGPGGGERGQDGTQPERGGKGSPGADAFAGGKDGAGGSGSGGEGGGGGGGALAVTGSPSRI